MRILVIGATGTIGSAVASALEARGHDVLGAGATSGDYRVDISDPASIERLYRSAGTVDAVVCAAGVARFGALDDLDPEDFEVSVRNKLLGQVELVRRGVGVVPEGGSFTLTSGDLSTAPEPGTVAVVMTGAAVEAFARAAALDLDGRYRVNVVSPGAVAESLEAAGRDATGAVRVRDVAARYVRAVEGHETGSVFDARAPAPSVD
jgi:NAD(P)-dependent dehydrogenase (short-subunit alcohol dehydrogenase family)